MSCTANPTSREDMQNAYARNKPTIEIVSVTSSPTDTLSPTTPTNVSVSASASDPTNTPTITPIPTNTPSPTSTIVSTYTPTPEPTFTPTSTHIQTPVSTKTNTPMPKKPTNHKRIVFMSGLCSTYPKESFNELSDWLMQNMGFDQSDFNYFNYSEGGKSGEKYDAMDTLNWISGDSGSAENFRYFLNRLHKTYPTSRFVIIAHSMGGNIALHSLATHDDIGYVSSVLTIDSPLRGVDLLKANLRELFPCVSTYMTEKLKTEHKLVNPPALYELLEHSDVTRTIGNTDYGRRGVHVVNLANTNDPVLLSAIYPAGELGTLPGDDAYILSFGLDPSRSPIERYKSLLTSLTNQHNVPLMIESLDKAGNKTAVSYVEMALRNAIEGK